jgi:hypothetical protein
MVTDDELKPYSFSQAIRDSTHEKLEPDTRAHTIGDRVMIVEDIRIGQTQTVTAEPTPAYTTYGLLLSVAVVWMDTC